MPITKEDIKIIYDDKHITVCIKPSGVHSQPDNKGSLDMTQLLSEIYGKNATPYVIHRLDAGVSGVMVYGKTSLAAKKLSEQIQNKTFEKEYLAVVCKAPAESCGIYKDLLFKDSSKNKSFVVDRMRKGVKEASLEYRVKGTTDSEKGQISLVWIKLHTGRTHQIRVQFASRKTPLLGDGKYGSRANAGDIALFSHRLSFSHPISGGKLSFQADPDNVFPWNAF
ncbi:MAG: RluA family pseudouridine synthase, partial [Clostridia bacterium]|nr:RluA family pseudouridine synthase [Clostridia bacterium]